MISQTCSRLLVVLRFKSTTRYFSTSNRRVFVSSFNEENEKQLDIKKPISSSSSNNTTPPRPFASLSVLEQVNLFSSLSPLEAIKVASEARLNGGGIALAAACLSQQDRAASFVSNLDSSGMRLLLILLADIAFLRGGSQASILSQHALPFVISRSCELLLLNRQSSGMDNNFFNLPLLAAASRVLSTHACICPAFSRLIERELPRQLLLQLPKIDSVDEKVLIDRRNILDELPFDEWSWLFESFAEGCTSAASHSVQLFLTSSSSSSSSSSLSTTSHLISADLVSVERILSGALRAGVESNAVFSLLEAFTNNRKTFQIKDSIKAEAELLRTITSICIDAKKVSPRLLSALILSINKRLEMLSRIPTCFTAIQSLVYQSMSDTKNPLSPLYEKLCRQFFGWKLGALFARGNALKSINALLAAARYLLVLRDQCSMEEKTLFPQLQLTGLNRIAKLANDVNDINGGEGGIDGNSPTNSQKSNTSSPLGDYESKFHEAVKQTLQSQPHLTERLGPVSFSYKIQSGATYNEAMFEVDVAFPKSKVAIEFDGPSHFLSIPIETTCTALRLSNEYVPTVQNPPEVYSRRELREDSAFLTRLLSLTKQNNKDTLVDTVLLCRPSPHHRLRSRQLQLLGWKIIHIPWTQINVEKAVKEGFSHIDIA
jgi:hypothetical protein